MTRLTSARNNDPLCVWKELSSTCAEPKAQYEVRSTMDGPAWVGAGAAARDGGVTPAISTARKDSALLGTVLYVLYIHTLLHSYSIESGQAVLH